MDETIAEYSSLYNYLVFQNKLSALYCAGIGYPFVVFISIPIAIGTILAFLFALDPDDNDGE